MNYASLFNQPAGVQLDPRRYLRAVQILPVDHLAIFGAEQPDPTSLAKVIRAKCYDSRTRTWARLAYLDDFLINVTQPDGTERLEPIQGWEYDNPDAPDRTATLIESCKRVTGPRTKWVRHNYPVKVNTDAQHYVKAEERDTALSRMMLEATHAALDVTTTEMRRSRLWDQLDYISCELYFNATSNTGIPAYTPESAARADLLVAETVAGAFGKPALAVVNPATMTVEQAAVCRAWSGDKLYWADVPVPADVLAELTN
jgi:hypothetical protein